MNMPELTVTFEQHLQAQTDDICALFDVMEKETSAIATRKSTLIESLATQKIAYIHKIQLRDIQLSKFPEIQKPSEDVQKIIDTIKETLKKCHQLNEANGTALQRAQVSMHKLRNLFQEAAGKHEMTYDSDGKSSGTRTLGTNIKV